MNRGAATLPRAEAQYHLTRTLPPRTTTCTGYHGTSTFFEPMILKDGLKPFRAGREVYFSPLPQRAEAYAKAWALGLHASGITPQAVAVIFKFKLDGTAQVRQESGYDLAVEGTVPKVEVDRRLDCLRLPKAERLGHVFNFLGVVAWDSDRYVADLPFDRTAVIDRLRAIIDRASEIELQEAINQIHLL